MPRKGYSIEQIVTKWRQAEIELGRGVRTPLVCKKLGVSEQQRGSAGRAGVRVLVFPGAA